MSQRRRWHSLWRRSKLQEADKFKVMQVKAGLSNEACAALLGVSVSTIEKRRSGAVRVANESIMALELYAIREKCKGVLND